MFISVAAVVAAGLQSAASAQTSPTPTEPVEVIKQGDHAIMIVVAGPHGERIALTADNRWKIIPPKEATLTDVDGNTYRAVRIGWALWMIDNLRVTRLNDGTPIADIAPGNPWAAAWQAPARAQLSDNPTIGSVYNWSAVATGKLCPAGWRVPSRMDFWNLQGPWNPPPPVPTTWGAHVRINANVAMPGAWPVNFPNMNTTGFSAIPAAGLQGNFRSGGGSATTGYGFALFYTSEINGTDPWYFSVASFREFNSLNAEFGFYAGENPRESRTFGLSVRCVRNEGPTNIFAE
jgi:uncharacterized protein (TIGR02145 family)